MTPRIRPDLRLDLILDRWIGAPTLALFGLVILSVPATVTDVFRDAQALLVGWILLAPVALPIFWVASRCRRRLRWYERLSWVFYNVEATPVRVDFELHGDGIICARLSPASERGEPKPFLSEFFLPVTWNHARFSAQIILAHIDPLARGPVVLETEDGILWPFGDHRKDLR